MSSRIRGRTDYTLSWSHQRPVGNYTNQAVINLDYGEYLAARKMVTVVQHSGRMPVPLLRLTKEGDQHVKTIPDLVALAKELGMPVEEPVVCSWAEPELATAKHRRRTQKGAKPGFDEELFRDLTN